MSFADFCDVVLMALLELFRSTTCVLQFSPIPVLDHQFHRYRCWGRHGQYRSALGKSNQIPTIARDEELDDIGKQLKQANKEVRSLESERSALGQQACLLPGATLAERRTHRRHGAPRG